MDPLTSRHGLAIHTQEMASRCGVCSVLNDCVLWFVTLLTLRDCPNCLAHEPNAPLCVLHQSGA